VAARLDRLRRLSGTRPVRRAARRRLGAWTLAIGVALVVRDITGDALAERVAWGRTVDVVVATAPVKPGEQFGGRVALRPVPVALVPDAAVRTPPGGRRAAHPIGRGEVVTTADLAAVGSGPVAARLPEGTAGVMVPVGSPVPPVAVGDRVDVVAPAEVPDPLAPARGRAPAPLTSGALVVAVEADRLTLAVASGDAARTAAAALSGPVAVVVRR
jgi:hypothetical protein